MKCEYCGNEIVELKTKKFNTEQGVIECTKVVQHVTSFKDIKVPKGFRLATVYEGVALTRCDSAVEWLNLKSGNNDFWIEQFNKGSKWAAFVGFIVGGGDFSIAGYNDLNSSGRSRGVLFIKKSKEAKR